MKRAPLLVVPLIVGPANAAAATGFTWRWCRDFWEARGRSFVGAGRKRGIPAAELLAELAATGAEPTTGADEPPIDAAEAVRRAIGVSRKSA